MVNIGDIVTVTIPTYVPLAWGEGGKAGLQLRLQQAGVEVLRIDDSALSSWGYFGGRQQLLVTVSPYSSAFNNVQDVANLVAGAAYSEGFDIDAGATARVDGYTNPQQGEPDASGYREIQRPPKEDVSVLDQLQLSTTTIIIVAAVALTLAFTLRK